MRGKVAKRIEELVPDTIATSRRGKKRAWNKINRIDRAEISKIVKNK